MNYLDNPANYRVTQHGDQFQPELHYQCRAGYRWVPLNEQGYWANPSDYSAEDADSTMALSLMDERTAQQAIWRAQKVNRGISS